MTDDIEIGGITIGTKRVQYGGISNAETAGWLAFSFGIPIAVILLMV